MADIKLKNTANTELTISHEGTRTAKSMSSTDIAVAVDTINDFPTTPTDGDVCIVRDIDRGGTFIYDSTEVVNSNDGTNFSGWIRQHTDKKYEAVWFGLQKEDLTTDSSILLQEIIDYVQEQEGVLILPEEGDLKLDNPITFKQGKNNTTDTIFYSVKIEGNNCTLRCNHDSDCISIVSRCLFSEKSTGRASGIIDIKDIIFDGYYISLNNYTNARALVIGNANYYISHTGLSLLENIRVSNFLSIPIYFISARHFEVNRVVTTGTSGGVSVQNLVEGFSGDITFNSCEFSGDESLSPFKLYTYTSSNTAEVRGIHVNDCIFYGSGVSIEASTNGKTQDIWMQNCAWDGPNAPDGETAIYIKGSLGTVAQVFIENPYVVNYSGDAVNVTSSSGVVKAVRIKGGRFSLCSGAQVIRAYSVESLDIQNCSFFDNVCSSEFNIGLNSNHVSIQNNSSQSTNSTYFITIGGAGTDNFIITGNIGVPTIVNDYSTATNKLVANNLQVI